MTRHVVSIAVVWALLVLDGAVFSHILPHASFGALAVAFFALERPLLAGAALAMATGLLFDVFSGTSRGLYAVTFVVVFFCARLLVMRIVGGKMGFITGTGLFCSVLAFVLAYVIQLLFGPGPVSLWPSLSAFPNAVLSAILFSYPTYWLLRRIDDRFKETDDDYVFRR